MLPETIIEGTADMKPEMNRPMTAPATDGVIPTMTQEIQYERQETI